jgi:hypothetical protein
MAASPAEPPDLTGALRFEQGALTLPFDINEVVDTLRLERYPIAQDEKLLASKMVRKVYYAFRPYMNPGLRQRLQRTFFRNWKRLSFPRWPVDGSVEQLFAEVMTHALKLPGVERIPFIWFWPDGATAASILTHDVEAAEGLAFVPRLMDLDDEAGLKAAFQFVPEVRYHVSDEELDLVRTRGHEVNIHGLDHDGNLFAERDAFQADAARINQHIKRFGAIGFRSPCMYRRPEWFKHLNIQYDMSIPNVAHLEPQRGGCCTVFPYFIDNIVELPLTMIQDYSLIHILGEYSLALWEAQMSIVLKLHGLASFIVHPDYLLEAKAVKTYRQLLAYLAELKRTRGLWAARPDEVNAWWRKRNSMSVVNRGGRWSVEGDGMEHARLAFASLKNGKLVYTISHGSTAA